MSKLCKAILVKEDVWRKLQEIKLKENKKNLCEIIEELLVFKK